MKLHLSLLGLASLFSSAVRASAVLPRQELAIRDYEDMYLATRDWEHDNTTLKLVGFSRVLLTDEERTAIEAAIREDPDKWARYQLDGAFYDHDLRELRVYFPVRDALVAHGGGLVEANERGELAHRAVDGDMTVIGRYETRGIHGDVSNTVRDGLIYLNEPNPVLRKRGPAANAHIYDFGFRTPHDHHGAGDDAHAHDAHDKRWNDGLFAVNRGCYKNHGNQVCTFAIPGVATGRCGRPLRSTQNCLDYNGWPLASCGAKSKIGFIGSDCFLAVTRGFCWNESRDYVCRTVARWHPACKGH